MVSTIFLVFILLVHLTHLFVACMKAYSAKQIYIFFMFLCVWTFRVFWSLWSKKKVCSTPLTTFNTVDHQLLLSRLSAAFGTALSHFPQWVGRDCRCRQWGPLRWDPRAVKGSVFNAWSGWECAPAGSSSLSSSSPCDSAARAGNPRQQCQSGHNAQLCRLELGLETEWHLPLGFFFFFKPAFQSPRAHLHVVGMLGFTLKTYTNWTSPLLFILFLCLFLSLWHFELYFIP